MKISLRKALTALALVVAAMVTISSPAQAEPYGDRWAGPTVPGAYDWTEPGLEPHSWEGWLRVQIWSSSAACLINYRIADTYNGQEPAGGTITVFGYRSFKVPNLDTSHFFQLGVRSWNCTVTARLSNYT